jgi:inhibitor of cysteine peptidase
MTSDSQKRRTLVYSAAAVLLLAGMLVVSGCTTQPATTPATTTVPTTSAPVGGNDMKVYNETANGTTVKIPLGTGGCIVRLAENPTTGYAWNATVTAGLAIVNDTYVQDPLSQGMVGAGGTHSWTLTGTVAGEQKFSAVYMRSWENVTGSEDTFVLHIVVEKP